jgi:hypothetical protein
MILANQQKVQNKYLNVTIGNGIVPAVTGTLVNTVMPGQGVTNGERESDSLSLNEINTRFYLQNEEAAIGINNVDQIRIVCVQARASTVLTISYSSAPTTGIFDTGSSGAVDITSMININAKNELFHVLYDRSYPVNFGSDSASRILEINLVPRVKKINFTPTTTTSLCGGVFWIFFSQNTSASLSSEERKVYHDL